MAQDFRDLQESRGWGLLNKIIAQQLDARVQTVMLLPAGAEDGNPISKLLNVEYMKGEYNGLVSVMRLPQVQIDMIMMHLTQQNEEASDATGNRSNTTP